MQVVHFLRRLISKFHNTNLVPYYSVTVEINFFNMTAVEGAGANLGGKSVKHPM